MKIPIYFWGKYRDILLGSNSKCHVDEIQGLTSLRYYLETAYKLIPFVSSFTSFWLEVKVEAQERIQSNSIGYLPHILTGSQDWSLGKDLLSRCYTCNPVHLLESLDWGLRSPVITITKLSLVLWMPASILM